MKSIFWSYFKNTLGWLLIHSPGPVSAIAKGAALVFDDVREDIFWLRDQLNPATCEDQYVAPHGEARGMDRHPLESDEQYRNRVVHARAWHGQGGKAQGMPRILEHYGYKDCSLYNCRKDDEARWAEFVLSVKASKMKERDYGLLDWAVQETKPARSKLSAVRVERDTPVFGAASALDVAGCARSKRTVEILLPSTLQVEPVETSAAGLARIQSTKLHMLQAPEGHLMKNKVVACGLVRVHRRIQFLRSHDV